MAVRPDGAEGVRAARVLASVPWIVVLLGVCALVVLLVVALLSFRTREPEPMSQAGPPVFLPTAPATASATATPTPTSTGVERRTPSPRPSRGSRTPSPRVSTSSPAPGRTSAPAASAVPLGPAEGTVNARYQVGTDGWDGDEAVLSVTNASGGALDWRVELSYDDDVRGLRVSGDSGVSVSARGDGEFVLRGTRSLAPGDSRTLRLRLGWDDSGERPDRCTVNGVDCQLG
ncbi:hypothetical protein GA0070607_4475 [Micromonospora coriariae]|uniref:Cellulose binding domain-containing protein n=1 Tax=Micromonospora coriariae TaxID=285665 RepID=A0A1C4WZX0_9ACTN|nr:hypothetical protein [Micromonospora coriariae]SCF01755.1 hypothetical protein GA0070607_4475 [Micromonospora coriariae]